MAQAYSWPAFSLNGTEDLSVLREQARAQGYEDGYQAGHQAALEELAAVRRTTSETLARIPDMQRQLEEADQQQLLTLIDRTLRALLGVELSMNPAIIASVVEEAVELLNCDRSQLILSISAEDEDWLQVEGFRTVVTSDQRPGSFCISSPSAAVEFDPTARLRTLMSATQEAQVGQPMVTTGADGQDAAG